MKITASAPGKTFLLGEYSVLAGGSALLVAINHRAMVNIYPSRSTEVLINADCKRRESIEHTPILESAIQGLEERELFDRGCLENHTVELDTSSFYSGGIKLGLGSSAALMVAILKALCPEKLAPNQLLDLASHCHTAFQGGLGSGADIATSVMEGCIHFKQGRSPVSAEIPPGLHLLFIWSGEAAITTNYVHQFDAWRRHAPTAAAEHLSALGSVSRAAIADFESRQTEEFVDKVAQFNQQLVKLSEETGLHFYTPAHQQLREVVEQAQCVYKPSGAGGGDFGIAFSTDAQKIMRLSEFLKLDGYLVLSAGEMIPSSKCDARSING
ncbi:MAG: hypothetical protein WD356_03585 [Pseudomonadales bacterium]